MAAGLSPSLAAWFVIGNGATVLIPISFGYAIVKHRVFDINVVVRRGVQYLLARNALRLVLSLPILALAFIIVSDRHLTLAELFSRHSSYLLLILAAAASLRFRSQLSVWVDRKFFREAYDREQMLLRLLEEIGRIDTLPEIAAIVSRELQAAFHPKAVYVWYRQGEPSRLKLGYSSGAHPKLPPVGDDAALVGVLEQKGSILEVPVSGFIPALSPASSSGCTKGASSPRSDWRSAHVPPGHADARERRAPKNLQRRGPQAAAGGSQPDGGDRRQGAASRAPGSGTA